MAKAKQVLTARLVSELLADEDWVRQVAALERKIARMHAVRTGDAEVVRYWRKPYREKKIRSYAGHYVHVVRPAHNKGGDRLRAQLRVIQGGKK